MEKLGIEPGLLLTQIINFLIIAGALTFFLYKPLLSMIEQRKKKIDEGLKMAQEMATKEEEIKVQKEKVLEKARLEAQKIIAESKVEAKEKAEKILNEAAEEVRLVKEKAKKDQEEEKERILDEAKADILKIALAIAKTALSDSLSDKAQMQIIEKRVERFEKEKINA